jgi:spore coat polysaccharide biosynthesis predicted glycosyltransferase SpsG/RimJ/RimL family protein N-acetyltransferase
MKVSIVTEGFSNTGYGHITRCSSIYQAFLDEKIQPTLFVNGDSTSMNLLNGMNSRNIDWLANPFELIADIQHSDILIIDSYKADLSLYILFSSNAALSVYLDDNMRIDYPKGVIVNGTINSEFFPYARKFGHEYFLGTSFIPLRKEFHDIPPKEISKNIQSILITFGGQDLKNFTLPVLKMANLIFPTAKKKVIIGSGFNDIDQFENYETEIVTMYYSPDASIIRDLMYESDIAISASGQTLYELAVCGTPTIAISVADNQKNNTLEWVRKSFIQTPVFSEDPDCMEKIRSSLISLEPWLTRKKISETGQQSVDGLGAKRIVNNLLNSIAPHIQLSLKPITSDDIQCLFQLANDPVVRLNSINTGSISWEEHVEWFQRRLTDQNCHLLIFHRGDKFVGQVRFDLSNDYAIINISLTEEFRGQGLAKRMILQAVENLSQHQKAIRIVYAYIRAENAASIKSFLASGFNFMEETLIHGNQFMRYKLENIQYGI